MYNKDAFRISGVKTRIVALAIALFVTLFSFASFVLAQDFTQGYSSDEQLIRGSIIALNAEDKNKVETVASDRTEDIYGIVVRANDSALTLTADRTGVFVTTAGRYEVLVADVNGNIQIDDRLSVSSLKGIGKLADATDGILIGKALESFDPTSNSSQVLSQVEAVDSEGNTIKISIGRILVDVGIIPNPDARRVQQVPQFLVSIAESITGNSDVSAFRIYSALAVLIVASGIAGSLLYSAVKNSIVAIGRNPLSKKSVLAGLAQVVIVGAIIFLSGLVAVYLILKI